MKEEQTKYAEYHVSSFISEADTNDMIHAYRIKNPENTKNIWFSLAKIEEIYNCVYRSVVPRNCPPVSSGYSGRIDPRSGY